MCAGREDRGSDPEHHRFLHELPPGIHHGDAAHGESGRVLLERPSDPDAARYAGTPGPGKHQEQILRQHHLEKEFPRRNAGHRGSQCPHRPAQPPHQSAAGRRGGRLQGQRRQRGRPGHAGRGTPDDLLGLQNGHGFHPDHKSRQPHSGRVQQLHARRMDGALSELRLLSAVCVGQHGVRQRQVAGRRCAVPLHRVRLSGQRIPLEER